MLSLNILERAKKLVADYCDSNKVGCVKEKPGSE
jgi:hypothetical protein